MAHPLRVNAAELLRRPGSEKHLELVLPVSDLDLHDERFRGDDEVAVRLRLESLTDGIVVAGEVTAPWHGICRRCAVATGGEVCCEVHELYQEVLTDPDAFELRGDQLDLEPMVREVLLLDAPSSPLCRDDCAGLCPTCGAPLDRSSCSCADRAPDPRWAALDQLRAGLPADEPGTDGRA
jgi:uncharacterized protein